MARTESSAKNTKRALKALDEVAKFLNVPDPVEVPSQFSKMIVNFLYNYCKSGTDASLSEDAMNAMIQGLINIYREHGHRGSWHVEISTKFASENSLIGNEDIKSLRSCHKFHLSRLGKSKKQPRPLPIEMVFEHAERFWFGCGNPIDFRDVLLHAIMIVELNLGFRYDEIHKMRIENVTVVPGMQKTGNILIFIPEYIKNSTKGREYTLRDWPGNTKMINLTLVDRFLALLFWMNVRGNCPGFLLCVY